MQLQLHGLVLVHHELHLDLELDHQHVFGRAPEVVGPRGYSAVEAVALDELGVETMDDLKLLTDEEVNELVGRLKPVEGRKFKAAMKARAMRARALGAMRARAFEAVQGSPEVASAAPRVVVAGATPVASAPPFAVTAEHA